MGWNANDVLDVSGRKLNKDFIYAMCVRTSYSFKIDRNWWQTVRWKSKWLNPANYHAINLLIELTNVLYMLCARVYLCFSFPLKLPKSDAIEFYGSFTSKLFSCQILMFAAYGCFFPLPFRSMNWLATHSIQSCMFTWVAATTAMNWTNVLWISRI